MLSFQPAHPAPPHPQATFPRGLMTHRSNEQLDAETAAINTETIAAGKWKIPAVNSELLALESILWDAN